MVKIIGVDIPDNKRLIIALTYIKGIGRSQSIKIIESLSLDPDKKVSELSTEEIASLNNELTKNYILEGDLDRSVRSNISRLVQIQCYRGIRHQKGLPVRGQGTQQNARTRKGKRKLPAVKKK